MTTPRIPPLPFRCLSTDSFLSNKEEIKPEENPSILSDEWIKLRKNHQCHSPTAQKANAKISKLLKQSRSPYHSPSLQRAFPSPSTSSNSQSLLSPSDSQSPSILRNSRCIIPLLSDTDSVPTAFYKKGTSHRFRIPHLADRRPSRHCRSFAPQLWLKLI